MKTMKPFFLFVIGFLLTKPVHSQSFVRQADSLRHLLRVSSPDTNRVHLLLELGQRYIYKLSELTSDLDTALSLSRQASALSGSLHFPKGQGLSHLVAAQAYREKHEWKKGQQQAQRAVDLLTLHGSLEQQADAYVELATYTTAFGVGPNSTGLNEEIRIYNHIVTLLQRARSRQKLADALKQRGDLYQLKSDNIQAMNDFRLALALYQSVGFRRLQHLYDLLGFVSGKTGDYDAGIHYGLLAKQTAEAFNDSILLVNIYNRLGTTYKAINQPEKALLYFNKAIAVCLKQAYKNTIIVLGITLSDILSMYSRLNTNSRNRERPLIQEALAHMQAVVRKRPADQEDIDCRLAVASCNIGLYGTLHHDLDRSQPHCEELEKMLTMGLGDDYQLYIHTILIPYYFNSKQYPKARILLTQNDRLCRRSNYAKELAINHLWWFKLDSTQAKFTSAIAHYQRYKTLNDSLFNETKNQKIDQLEVQYQTQEKEHNIEQLKQQSRLQQSDLQKEQTIRNFMIAGAFMLILLLGLLFNRYRLKQQNNQLLEAKQVEINQKNQSLQQVLGEKEHLLTEKEELLTEKEWMLKEIHHRVKNNLQIITSLLHSQAIYLRDPAALSAIRESQNRVHAMALIHQKLYQSERLSSVPMNDYIAEIVDYLITTFDRQKTVKRRFDVAPIDLDITLAVPLGLIINEAVTNALKYGFPLNRTGIISVELGALAPHTYQLTISDNGVGLPADFNPSSSPTLGMSLIRGLSKQLDGQLEIRRTTGVAISLVFAEEKVIRKESIRA